MKAIVSVNFGPSYIIKPETSHIFTKTEANSKTPISIIPVSELQPMSPDDRKVHEARIAAIKERRRLEIEKQNNIKETINNQDNNNEDNNDNNNYQNSNEDNNQRHI